MKAVLGEANRAQEMRIVVADYRGGQRTGVGLFRTKFTPHGPRWVNRISGLIITGFDLLALLDR